MRGGGGSKNISCGELRYFRSTVGTVLVLFRACASLWSVDMTLEVCVIHFGLDLFCYLFNIVAL